MVTIGFVYTFQTAAARPAAAGQMRVRPPAYPVLFARRPLQALTGLGRPNHSGKWGCFRGLRSL